MISIGPKLMEKVPSNSEKIDLTTARQVTEQIMGDSPNVFRRFNIIMTILWFYSIIDAYIGAKKRQKPENNLLPPNSEN